MDEIIEKEVILQQSSTRRSEALLNELLHSDFYEIGYSGLCYNRKRVIESLLAGPDSAYEILSQNYEVFKLDTFSWLLVYQSAEIQAGGKLSRYAHRSSIWQNVSGLWKLRFHQATPTRAFSKNT